MISVLGFAGPVVSVTGTLLYCRGRRSHRQYVNQWAWLCLINFIYKTKQWARFGPQLSPPTPTQVIDSTREDQTHHVYLDILLLSIMSGTHLLLTLWWISEWVNNSRESIFIPLNSGLWHTYSDSEMHSLKFCQQRWQRVPGNETVSIQGFQALWQMCVC